MPLEEKKVQMLFVCVNLLMGGAAAPAALRKIADLVSSKRDFSSLLSSRESNFVSLFFSWVENAKNARKVLIKISWIYVIHVLNARYERGTRKRELS